MEFEFFSPKSLFKISNANITPQFLLLPKVPFLWAMGGPFQGLAQDFTQKTASLLHPSFLFNFWIICSVAAFQLFMEFSSTPQPPLGVPRLLFHCWFPAMLPMTDSTHMPPESTMDCVEFTRDILAACEPMQEILSTMCY